MNGFFFNYWGFIKIQISNDTYYTHYDYISVSNQLGVTDLMQSEYGQMTRSAFSGS